MAVMKSNAFVVEIVGPMFCDWKKLEKLRFGKNLKFIHVVKTPNTSYGWKFVVSSATNMSVCCLTY